MSLLKSKASQCCLYISMTISTDFDLDFKAAWPKSANINRRNLSLEFLVGDQEIPTTGIVLDKEENGKDKILACRVPIVLCVHQLAINRLLLMG